MAREQLGICAEANLHGSYLFFNALDGQQAVLRHKLARLPVMIDRLAEHFSESMLSLVVAIGPQYWDKLYPQQRPAEFNAFPSYDNEHLSLATEPVDIFIQLRSDRLDVTYLASQQVQQLLAANTELIEQLSGFHYLDGRDLTGFSINPCPLRGLARRKSALLPDTEFFAGGSYVFFSRLHFDVTHWQQLNQTEQEQLMGFSKISGKVLAGQAEHSHWQTLLEEGAPPSLLQQSMPFGRLKEQGLLSVSFCAQPNAYLQLLQRRLGLAAVPYDPLLDYYQADLCTAFFAPSISFLEQAAKQA